MKKPTVICLANQKGGIGKTTTSTALASMLEERGYRTLLIDTDLQCNSTDTYKASYEGVPTLYDVLLEEHPAEMKDVIQRTEAGDIVPADPLLREADAKLSQRGFAGYTALKNAADKMTDYDFVIIDTAPSINFLLRNVLVASDYVVIPMTTDRYGIQGLYELNAAILDVKQLNPGIKVAGILLVKYNARTILGREVTKGLKDIADTIGTKIFSTSIRESTKAREAQAARKLLIQYDKTCTTAQDHEAFTDELLKEIKDNG